MPARGRPYLQVRGRLYSPDLNPIEPAFAKFKAWLRCAEPRTNAERDKAIVDGLNQFSISDCRNFNHNAGYAHP